MSLSPASMNDEMSLLMEMSIANIARGLAGEDMAAIGQQQASDCLRGFCAEIEEVAANIIRPEEQTQIQGLGDCISSMRSSQPYSPEIAHVEHLRSTVERLQQIAIPLKETLAGTYQELERQRQEKEKMQGNLASLRSTLAKGKGQHYPGQAELLMVGSKVCTYLGGSV